MPLTTLTGTISAAALDNNFGDKLSALHTTNTLDGKDFQVDHRVLDLTSSTTARHKFKDFTAPDDLQLITAGLTVWNPDATTRTITMTLTVIDDEESDAGSKYLTGQTVSLSVTATSATEFNATRPNYESLNPAIYLIKGVTYRLTLSSNHAGAVDSAYGFILARQYKRYK